MAANLAKKTIAPTLVARVGNAHDDLSRIIMRLVGRAESTAAEQAMLPALIEAREHLRDALTRYSDAL